MSNDYCPNEEKTLAAARSGHWSEQERQHRDSCSSCSDLAMVESLMAFDLQDEELSEAPLPDPHAIWQRHRELERARRFEMATLPIRVLELVVSAVGAAVAAVILVGFFPTLTTWFRSLAQSTQSNLAALPAAGSSTLMAVAAVGTFVLVLYSLHSQWASD